MNVHVQEPIIVDLFAGGGGASTGIEMALGRSPDVAINHDPVAIAMHQVNHPDTLHFCNDIWAVDPLEVLPGRKVGLLWASPDCKHFSKAKGGRPKDRNIRDLAWVVVDWAEKRQPDVIGVENVEEFQTWGPLDNEGRPIPEFAGQTFEDWLTRLRKAGYKVEWRESRASSYGAPTIRKRLIILATRIGKPRWPKPTHGNPKAKDFDGRRMEPWKTAAADVIDWSLPCPSIFDDKGTIWERHALRAVRPLAHNTGARVARGIRRYVLDAQEPFIVNLTHGARTESAAEPLRTVTGANRGEKAVVAPSIARFNGDSAGTDAREPLPTVTANSYLKRPGGAAPLGVVAPHLMTMRNAGKPFNGADEPTHTVTAGGAGLSCVAASMVRSTASAPGGFPAIKGENDDDESDNRRACGLAGSGDNEGWRAGGEKDGVDRNCRAEHPTGFLHSFGPADHRRGRAARSAWHLGGERSRLPELASTPPAPATVAAFLAQHNNDSRRVGGVNPGREADKPLSTITVSGAQQGVVAAHMMTMKGSDRRASDADAPVRGVCAGGTHEAIVSGALVKYYGTGDGQTLDEALHTVTVKDRFGFAEAALSAPPFGPEHEARAREVADFMRAHGQWPKEGEAGEFVTLELGEVTFIIVDIGLRMLTPRELFNAQGFPPDYRIDRDDAGNVFSKSDQVGRAGNSVSPPWAAAHVAANCGHLKREPVMEAAE